MDFSSPFPRVTVPASLGLQCPYLSEEGGGRGGGGRLALPFVLKDLKMHPGGTPGWLSR